MKQRTLGSGGALDQKTPQTAYEKPKKSIPKKKVTAADMKATWMNPKSDEPEGEIVEEEAPKFKAPVYTVDDALIRYLVKVDTMGDDNMDQAREYLMRGPPFKGTHDKGYKIAIKDLGLRWLKNPNFVEGEWGSGQRFGWYVAHDVKELKSALTMPRKIDGERAWSPCDIGDVSMRLVDELIERHAEEKAHKNEAMRKAEDERRHAKEIALGRGSGMMQADLPQDIEKIRQYMTDGGFPDWEYDRDLIASSSTCAALGPVTPTNAIRVVRGLRFNIITPAQVAKGQWDSDAVIARRKRENEAALTSKRRLEAMNMEQQEEANLKKLKIKAERATSVLKRDDEMETDEQGVTASSETVTITNAECGYIDTSLLYTACKDCGSEIHEQFMDCGCEMVMRLWEKCKTCRYAFSDAQTCECVPTNAEIELSAVDEHVAVEEDATGLETDKLNKDVLCMSAKARGKQKAVSWEE